MWGFLKRLFWGRSLSQKSYKKFMRYVEKLEGKNPRTQIIDADKIYHAILKDLGYRGSFGEILKREPREIKNLQELWELHKLRNRLVHELEEPKVNLKKNAENYKGVILAFLASVGK